MAYLNEKNLQNDKKVNTPLKKSLFNFYTFLRIWGTFHEQSAYVLVG